MAKKSKNASAQELVSDLKAVLELADSSIKNREKQGEAVPHELRIISQGVRKTVVRANSISDTLDNDLVVTMEGIGAVVKKAGGDLEKPKAKAKKKTKKAKAQEQEKINQIGNVIKQSKELDTTKTEAPGVAVASKNTELQKLAVKLAELTPEKIAEDNNYVTLQMYGKMINQSDEAADIKLNGKSLEIATALKEWAITPAETTGDAQTGEKTETGTSDPDENKSAGEGADAKNKDNEEE